MEYAKEEKCSYEGVLGKTDPLGIIVLILSVAEK